MIFYNMAKDPDEIYYGAQYWNWIERYLQKFNVPRGGRFLDLGAGYGRMTLKLAGWTENSAVIDAVDESPLALGKLKKQSDKLKLKSISCRASDALEFISGAPDDSYDAILLLEVIYMLKSPEKILASIKRILKRGGALFLSYRPALYNIIYNLKRRSVKGATRALKEREGDVFYNNSHFSWNNHDEMESILKKIGFANTASFGIGVCTGLKSDPMGKLVRPSSFNEKDKKALMEIELALAEKYKDEGRYVLTAARKY